MIKRFSDISYDLKKILLTGFEHANPNIKSGELYNKNDYLILITEPKQEEVSILVDDDQDIYYLEGEIEVIMTELEGLLEANWGVEWQGKQKEIEEVIQKINNFSGRE